MLRTRLRLSPTIGALVAAALFPLACGSDLDGVEGSGDVVTEQRTVSDFDEILLEGGGDIVVTVGETESLTVEAEDNLLPHLSTEVKGSRLELRTRRSVAPTRPIVYTIGAIEFDAVSIVGSGDLVATNLDCESFVASVAGAGTLDLTGRCTELELDIAGSGDFAGEDFEVSVADIDIAGSGDVIIHATDELNVQISGSGDVEYLGDPSTDIDIAGSGDVRKR